MKYKFLKSLLLIVFHLGLCSTQKFISDLNCKYSESASPFSFDVTPTIDFYIPHNWVNNDDELNYLRIKLFSTNLVLRHPSSTKSGPDEISLPLEKLKVGWNKLYLRKNGKNLQVVEKSEEDNSINVIQSLVLPDITSNFANEDPLSVSGLYSIVDCLQGLNTRYYQIPAKSSVKIPYVMFKQVDRFDAQSEGEPFSFEITISGKRRPVCHEEIRSAPDVYSVPRDCRHWPVSSFSPNTIYNIFMYPATFDAKDVLSYKDFTFSDFIIHNTGDTDFYIRTFIKPSSNAPISELKEGAPSPEEPSLTTTTARPTPPVTDPSVSRPKGCGVNTRKSLHNRIIGGDKADPKDWAWMAALLYRNGKFMCGGVLITDKHVLTAAHCILTAPKNSLKVRLGEYDFDDAEETNPRDFNVQQIIPHERYDIQSKHNDIAILVLDLSAPFNEFIYPICLPSLEREFKSDLGIVAGWGATKLLGPASRVLKEVVIPIKPQRDCANIFRERGYLITDEMLCAGLRGQDACQGDSGGPFMVQDLSDSRWYVKGIVSFGEGCGGNVPGIYTRVSAYREWIGRNTGS